jgi:hypothetical protein
MIPTNHSGLHIIDIILHFQVWQADIGSNILSLCLSLTPMNSFSAVSLNPAFWLL